MEQKHYFNLPTSQKFKFEELEFSPINVEYFQNLLKWHKKDFQAIQRVLMVGEQDVNEDAEARLNFLETVTCMIHTATYPSVEDTFSRDVWKNMVSAWVLRYPELVTWFLNYLVEFLPTAEEKSSGKKSSTPGKPKATTTSMSWTGVTSSDD